MNQPDAQTQSLAEFDRQPHVAYVEVDRYCDGCGYNLRTQPVRTDPGTGLLLCRCPECGQFHPARDTTTAGRAWLGRLGILLLFIWILVIIAGVIGLGAAQVGVSFGTLEELTTHRRITINTPIATQPARPNPANTQITGTSIIIGPGGNVTNTTTITTYRREVRADFPHYDLFMVLMRSLSFFLGFALAALAVVVLPHWRRWGYLVPITLVPILAGMLVWLIWREEVPHLLDWSIPYIVTQAAAHFAGGLTGILLGRPLTRLIVALTLPARIRQVLAFLWLADGKRPPTVAHERAGSAS